MIAVVQWKAAMEIAGGATGQRMVAEAARKNVGDGRVELDAIAL